MVIEYLRSHPDFFAEHPALLRELSIPHELPEGVASLIERQVAQLRSECAGYRQELDHRELRAGVQLTALRDVLEASLRVMRADRPAALCTAVRNCLRHNFTSTSRVFVFRDGLSHKSMEGLRFLPPSSALRRMFIEVINMGKPLSGSLQGEHIDVLFGSAARGVRSTLLVPLNHAAWDGLVAVGSSEHGRLGAGQERELLVYLFRAFGLRLDQLIAGPVATRGTA